MKFILALLMFFAVVPASAQPAAFPVAPHSNVGIEWWYLNAHMRTASGRHLAMIISFFRFGNAQAVQRGAGASAGSDTVQSHYLIYAITDLDAKTHSAYSLADRNSLNMIQQLASLSLMANQNSRQAQQLLAMTAQGEFPPPTTLISGACRVTDPPRFAAIYGQAASVRAVPGQLNTYELVIGSAKGKTGGPHLDLTFTPTRAPMYVNGNGNTGIGSPEDMKYVSLTRCRVSGTVQTAGGKPDRVLPDTSNIGWFDHQWGSSWTPMSVRWDWWGVQLADGRDILFYQLRNRSTGAVIDHLATIEDASGAQTTTHDITMTPDESSYWTSPTTNSRYPLRWTVEMPSQHIRLKITPDVLEQEMPILATSGAIWEGSVNVEAFFPYNLPTYSPLKPISGVGYQELVGYGAR